MAEFKETLAAMKAACKAGDIPAIAEKAGTSQTTVRKLFTRETALELTEKERDVWDVCCKHFAERFEKARNIENQAAELLNG